MYHTLKWWSVIYTILSNIRYTVKKKIEKYFISEYEISPKKDLDKNKYKNWRINVTV